MGVEPDGAVLAFGPDGQVVARLAPPWARDADGRSVPTHFELDGLTVVQIVEHRGGGFAYGIVADPWWNPFSWDWSRIGRTAVSGLTRCGGGALKGALGVGGGVVTVNLIRRGAGTFLVRAAGGPTSTSGRPPPAASTTCCDDRSLPAANPGPDRRRPGHAGSSSPRSWASWPPRSRGPSAPAASSPGWS